MANWLKFRLQEEAGEEGAEGGEGAAEAGVVDAGAEGAAEDDVSRETGEGEGVNGYWPDDWQSRLSKGDEKLAKQFGRYASPEAVGEALIAAQNKIRSGQLTQALPENPTEDELKSWRKDNGIPEAPDKYDLKFDSGLVIGEEDKPIIDSFLETAHGKNLNPDQAKAAVEWYYQEQERQEQAIQEQDNEQRQEALDALNVEWGANFRPNINRVEGLLSKFPEDIRDNP
jgi:hypothetical protein